jgi:hypothetical protein
MSNQIIIINKHFKEFPLVIASNRDGDFVKAPSSIQVLSREPHLIMGEKNDDGVLFGTNKNSLFATYVNNNYLKNNNAKKENINSLIIDLLQSSSLEEMFSRIKNIDITKFNNFNLVFGNQNYVFLGYSFLSDKIIVKEVGTGVHLINDNMSPEAVGQQRAAKFAHDSLNNIDALTWHEYYKYLKEILSSNVLKVKPIKAGGKLQGIGTISSSILAFSKDELVRYKFFDRITPRVKEPCIPRYKDYIDMFRDSKLDSAIEQEEHGDLEEVEEPILPIMQTMSGTVLTSGYTISSGYTVVGSSLTDNGAIWAYNSYKTGK